MKKLLLLLFAALPALMCTAQDAAKKDSLLQLLPQTKNDSAGIMLLVKVSALYAKGNFDSSLLYMNKAAELATAKQTAACAPFINNGYFLLYYYHNDYKQAIAYAVKNIAIGEKNSDEKLLAKTYNNLASANNESGNYKAAIAYSLKCLAVTEKIQDSAGFPLRNLTVSNTYYNLKQYDKSIYYSKRAIAFGNQFNNSFAVLMGLNNMAAAYSGLHKIDSAIAFFEQQLALAKKEADTMTMYYALVNLCQNNFTNNNLAGVEKYSAQLHQIAPEITDKKTIAEIYNVNALRFILRKEYTQAKAELDSGIAYAKKENADAIGNLYQAYSKFYFIQNNIKAAEDYAYKYDSLQSVANIKELNFYIEDLSIQYETEKKEARLQLQQAQLQQKSNLIYFLVAGTVALLLISLLTYRNYRNRQNLQQAKIDELEAEKQLTATEAVLKGEEQERTRLAKDLHDGLGGMLSGIKYSLSNMKENLIMTPDNAQAFERSIDMLDSSIREMRRVAHNMMPEILVKYGLDTALKEFCGEIDRSGVISTKYLSIGMSDTTISQTVAVSVYRIIQELVNNTIKHAGAQQVLVQVHASAQEKLLALTVEDDGKGFDTAVLKQPGGIGWDNIRNRVEFLKGKVDVQSAPGQGTSVLIEIKL
ncbi:MAG: sensor histidine kinase [Bacteroidetes bacterium]|nr:sensor histidine kinase [Bacteroidota bacterium]